MPREPFHLPVNSIKIGICRRAPVWIPSTVLGQGVFHAPRSGNRDPAPFRGPEIGEVSALVRCDAASVHLSALASANSGDHRWVIEAMRLEASDRFHAPCCAAFPIQ
jgi:hypothetical protein